jgi:hypothetical protein
MGGVGRKTVMENIQVSYSGDDCFEWFGGTVNGRNLIAIRGWDDDFDVDFGFRGKVQFGLVIRDGAIADQSQSNGFESDNDGTGSIEHAVDGSFVFERDLHRSTRNIGDAECFVPSCDAPASQ